MSTSCNVLIVGAGPAGVATGLLLARGGLSVLVTDYAASDAIRVGETVSPAIRPLLAQLGLDAKFDSDAHAPAFGTRSCWGGAVPVDTHSITNPYGNGWHLDRSRFNVMLVEAATEAGCSLRLGTRIRHVSRKSSNSWQVELSTRDSSIAVDAEFIVDASGRAAAFVRKQGATRRVFDHLIGAYSFFDVEEDARQVDSFTLIESTPDGWWYSASLPDNRLAVALMTDGDLADPAILRTRGYWMEKARVTEHTIERILGHSAIGNISLHAAGTTRTLPVFGDRWMAVGDAAMSWDPLSGQGIQNALENARFAAEVILSWYEQPGTSGFVAYGQYIKREFAKYARSYAQYYRHEQRWPNAIFWERRHSAAWTDLPAVQ